jgi:homocysteine S-methyltransferase
VSIARAYHRNVRNPFEPFLEDRDFVVLDGALATELERRGQSLDDPLWSARTLIEAPELIESVHHDYFAAGADVGTSSSYQATFEGFAKRGLNDARAEELLRLSVALVRRARDRFWRESSNHAGRRRPLVAASVGCYGAFLHDGSEYRGDYGLGVDELMDFHRRRLRVLADAGCDLLAFETIPSRLEAEAILRLLEEDLDAPPAWLSFSCRNGKEVSHGERFRDCVQIAGASERVVGVGINCTSPARVSSLLRSAKGATDKLLLVYPNSGESWDGRTHRWTADEPCPPLGELVSGWYRLGARGFGGCCRTTPDDIRELGSRLGSAEKVVSHDAPDRP